MEQVRRSRRKDLAMSGGRISRGWALTKQSFRVLRADRSLLLFPVISVPAGVLAAAIVMGPGVALYAADKQEAFLIAFGVLTLYVLTLVTVFFNTRRRPRASTARARPSATASRSPARASARSPPGRSSRPWSA
jgi:hypothetical protein